MNSFVILYRLDFNIARITKNNLTNGYTYLVWLLFMLKILNLLMTFRDFCKKKASREGSPIDVRTFYYYRV